MIWVFYIMMGYDVGTKLVLELYRLWDASDRFTYDLSRQRDLQIFYGTLRLVASLLAAAFHLSFRVTDSAQVLKACSYDRQAFCFSQLCTQ